MIPASMYALVLAHTDDATALQIYQSLKTRSKEKQIRFVSGEELIFAPRWIHRQGEGRVTTEIHLRDGCVIRSEDLCVVFNRLCSVSMPHFRRALPSDHDYAIMEMFALLLSWLASLSCPVINPVSNNGLSHPQRTHAEWLYLAGQAGLQTIGYHFTTNPLHFPNKHYRAYPRLPQNLDQDAQPRPSSLFLTDSRPVLYLEPTFKDQQRVLVIGQQSVGQLAELFRPQLSRLARLASCSLLEVIFARTDSSDAHYDTNAWKVYTVNPFPKVRSAEELQYIVTFLETQMISNDEVK